MEANTTEHSSEPVQANCAICLNPCSSPSFANTCMHQFCFACLLRWSQVKAECPLCKQRFTSILYNVRSNEEYDQYNLPEILVDDPSDDGMFIVPSEHRFLFSTTFTVNTVNENAIQQMLRTHSHSSPSIRICNNGNRRALLVSRNIRNVRRYIYEHDLWANPLPDITGRYRNCSPRFINENPTVMHRLTPWLFRDLAVLLYENETVLLGHSENISNLLNRYPVLGRQFYNAVEPILGTRARHFIHELHNFMRSPYDLIGYDRHVTFTEGQPTIEAYEEDSDVEFVDDAPAISENVPVLIELISSSEDSIVMTSVPTTSASVLNQPRNVGSAFSRRRRISRATTISSSDEESNARSAFRRRSRSRLLRRDDTSSESSSNSTPDEVRRERVEYLSKTLHRRLRKTLQDRDVRERDNGERTRTESPSTSRVEERPSRSDGWRRFDHGERTRRWRRPSPRSRPPAELVALLKRTLSQRSVSVDSDDTSDSNRPGTNNKRRLRKKYYRNKRRATSTRHLTSEPIAQHPSSREHNEPSSNRAVDSAAPAAVNRHLSQIKIAGSGNAPHSSVSIQLESSQDSGSYHHFEISNSNNQVVVKQESYTNVASPQPSCSYDSSLKFSCGMNINIVPSKSDESFASNGKGNDSD